MSPRGLIGLLFLIGVACVLFAGCAAQPPGSNNTTAPTVPPTATSNVTSTRAPTPAANVTDLTNRNSSEVANFTTYPSTTRLHDAVPIALQRVAGGFTSPLQVADPRDGSGRLFLVDQNGYVKIFSMNGTVIDEPFLDLRDRMVNLSPTYDERGLLSVAFHPNFSENGKVYAYYSAPLRAGVDPNWSCTNRISEFTVSNASPNRVDNTTERILLEIDKPYQNHNGGQLLFGPEDGYLYIPLGDGGRADDTGMGHTPGIGNAQDLTTILGKVIRIDVDTTSPERAYGIPSDNPFLSNASIRPEIYAYGFRNPAFAAFDSGGSHRMFVAMAGQRLFESVLVIYRGGAYPWNIREGTHCFDPADNSRVPNDSCRITSYSGQPLIGPIVELGHDVGNTVVGGAVYRGSAIPSLDGAYLFGTWSDESRTLGNGTLLVARPPAGLDTATLPDDAADLTPAQNAMWNTSELTVANNANGRLNAFLRGLFENADREVLVLVNLNGGPGLTPDTSGEVWRMVPANTTGLVPIGNASASPNGTPRTTPTPTFDASTYMEQDSGSVVTYPSSRPVASATTSSGTVATTATPTNLTPTVTTAVPTITATTVTPNTTPTTPAGTATVAPTTPTTVTPPPTTATAAPTVTTVPPTTAVTTAATTPGAVTVPLTAQNLAFSTSTITVPAGAQVTIAFNNMDASVSHNVALYTDSSATTSIFRGAVITGPATTTYTFTAPSTPGTYFFRCDIHPTTMTGQFVVQ